MPTLWKIAHIHPIPKKAIEPPASCPLLNLIAQLNQIEQWVQLQGLCDNLSTLLGNGAIVKHSACDHQYGSRHEQSGGNLLIYLTHRWAEAVKNSG